ncbi:hypothetical protein HK096_002917, partial [Nowakowskiella sp. JEL0078]
MPRTTNSSRQSARRRNHNPFNLLIAGHASSGKSQFLRTLYESLDVKKLHFATEVEQSAKGAHPSPFIDGDVLTPTPLPARIEFEEELSGIRILLRLVDSPGLPIPVNIHKSPDRDYSALSNAWSSEIIKYLELQFEATLLEESKVKRNPKSPDYQTHAMLYFIDPNVAIANKGLTPIDRTVMERLSARVNIIPVLAKGDLLSVRQLKTCRKYVMDDIKESGIQVFNFPDDKEEENDPESLELNEELRGLLPFSIINSEIQDDGSIGIPVKADDGESELVLGREYPWGLVESENPLHCDFIRLKQILFATHTDDLKVLTREVLYEQWRTEKLLEVRGSVLGRSSSSSPVENSLGRASLVSQDQVKKRSNYERNAPTIEE